MEKLSKELQDLVRERKLYVEVELRQKRNENDKYTCILQKIAVEFAEKYAYFVTHLKQWLSW